VGGVDRLPVSTYEQKGLKRKFFPAYHENKSKLIQKLGFVTSLLE
jgi:hypothetical protein